MSGLIRIRDLEFVIALHEEGNLTQAAKRIGISEPALSKRLRLIERRVQVKLFNRGTKGAVATDSGRFFVERAQVSIQAFYQGVHDAQEAKYSDHHKLRIGASAFLAPRLIELLHSTELRLYRNLSCEIITEYSCEILQQLQHHQIDLALITSPPPSASITSVRVAVNPFMIVVRPDHPLAAESAVRLSEVAKYPWVFFNRHVHPPLYDLIMQRMETLREKPNVIHHVSQADQVAALLTDNALLGRGKCQTRTIVWHADGAGPNGLRKARSARFYALGRHRSGTKWKKGARSAYREFVLDVRVMQSTGGVQIGWQSYAAIDRLRPQLNHNCDTLTSGVKCSA